MEVGGTELMAVITAENAGGVNGANTRHHPPGRIRGKPVKCGRE
jgi:hypothetical protein